MTMRHAFLIIAHNNWWQLKQLVQLLDAENHDIYVHIDKKSTDFDVLYFNDAVRRSKLQFFQEYKVYWGGYSQVQVEMLLFEKAHKVGYDYYHLLSGVDLPLKSNEEIDEFFEKNAGKQFITFDEDKLANDPEIRRRTRLYHYLQNYRRHYKQKWKNEIFTFLKRISLVFQLALHVDRTKKMDWTIKYGSNWVSVTDALVSRLLGEKEKIEDVFSYTNCADELIVQTIAYNCGFKEQIYRAQNGYTENVRFIDWKRGKNGNPYTFRIQDEKMLSETPNLFARKFSESIDKDIIILVIKKIRSEE